MSICHSSVNFQVSCSSLKLVLKRFGNRTANKTALNAALLDIQCHGLRSLDPVGQDDDVTKAVRTLTYDFCYDPQFIGADLSQSVLAGNSSQRAAICITIRCGDSKPHTVTLIYVLSSLEGHADHNLPLCALVLQEVNVLSD